MFNLKLHRNFKRALPLALLGAAMALTPLGAVSAASLSSGDGNIVLTSPYLQASEPVTLYSTNPSLLATLDPQRGEDEFSIAAIENLFLGLTDIDPKTDNIRPELAKDWTTSDAGDVWTFNLRNDVPWIRWDPKSQTATKVRMVTAQDVEYGMKRSCDPRLGAYYTGVAAAIVKGCDVVSKIAPDQIKDSDFDQIGVKALSDTQLQVTTQGVIPYFLSTSGMWMFRPVPKETIAEFGDKWIEPGNIVTNGPFVIDEWDKPVDRTYIKNPYYVEVNDSYGGNLERIKTIIVKDGGTDFSLYQANQIESTGIPGAELTRVRNDAVLSKEIFQTSTLSVFYYGFAFDKPPFDNVHVRRAFSAMLDRNTYVTEVAQGRAVPMAHFMPPGIRGAVPINEVGLGDPTNLGYDPAYAKSEMTAAGYANCQGFPGFTILTQEGAQADAEFMQNAMKTVLGCDASKVNIESAEFSVYIQQVKKENPTPQRPNVFTSGWGPDYPDAQNWIHDVLSCNAADDFARPCGPIDQEIDAASKELDPAKRDADYRNLETEFFGKDGLFPMAPMYLALSIGLVKPWYTGFFNTDGIFGGPHWNTRKIDQAAQLAARGGANKPFVVPTAAPTAAPTSAQ